MSRYQSSGLRWKIIHHLILGTVALLCLIPMIVTLSVSFSDEMDLVRNGYSVIPRIFSTAAYDFIFKAPKAILSAYWVTIQITAIGTFMGTMVMAMVAYPLSRPDFKWRRIITFYIFFTMLFNGGLVPTYILISRYLHLRNTLFAMILPVIITAWNIFLLMTFMKSIPLSLVESAKIDGASEFLIFSRIIVPLSKPALATIALLLALRLWNEWFTAMLYITDQQLVPLQFWMQRVMRNMQFLLSNQDMVGGGVSMADLPTESVRMAMAVLAAGPMVLVFPFFQKYFAKGLKVGAVKG
ncbi:MULTISPECIES: carbohydrate ABC transporter permease [unclassified Oceanispirochaeta]|uniref:carbohydrate ABC transporter permease n=1 Tax=unclassified Oceanispirochaeta TaxID=2635722 RepID=UPI0018F781B8|nr:MULTISPECIES: carbohydrate ABC transporter permease [unclassified Oceanispirochaeta]